MINDKAIIIDWQANAQAVVANLADDLWRPEQAKVRQWLNKRGIDDAAIYRYSLGYTHGGMVNGLWLGMKHGPNEPSRPERGIVIPHWSQRYRTMFGLKVRRSVPPDAPNKYYCATGSKPATNLFNADSMAGKEVCFVTGGELDTLALHSKISDLAAVVTLGSKGAKLPDRWLSDLYHVRRFIIVTDCNEDEEAADYWLSLVGKRGRRFILPGNAKNICEAARGGLDLRDWATAVMISIGAKTTVCIDKNKIPPGTKAHLIYGRDTPKFIPRVEIPLERMKICPVCPICRGTKRTPLTCGRKACLKEVLFIPLRPEDISERILRYRARRPADDERPLMPAFQSILDETPFKNALRIFEKEFKFR